jgi:hypothetical protein
MTDALIGEKTFVTISLPIVPLSKFGLPICYVGM